MRTTTDTPHPARPDSEGTGPTPPSAQGRGPGSRRAGDRTGAERRSLWRALGRPDYLVSRGPWTALAALLTDPVLAVASLIAFLLVVGVLGRLTHVSGLFAVLLVAFPFVAAALVPLYGLWYGAVGRWRLRLLGFSGVATGHVPMPVRPLRRWAGVRLQEPATWRELVAALFGALFLWVELLVLAAEALCLWITGAVLWLLVSRGTPVAPETDVPPFRGLLAPDGTGTDLVRPDEWWQVALALLLQLVVFAYLNGLLAALSGTVVRALLAPRPEEMQRQVDKLAFSRAAILDSFEAERRRIERDLHDGVQQELVNLGLRLGMAEMEVAALREQGADVGAAAEQISRAQAQTSHALQTLRNTVRGIYPAVLEDHGLRPALEELVGHCMIPAELHWAASAHLPAEVERTAYYAASEAVTNVLKHSTATRIRITAHTTGGELLLDIEDNGQGGAEQAAGGGLAGLDERAAALGGSVALDSPRGGPTVVRVRIPWDGGRPDSVAPSARTPWSRAGSGS